MSSVSSATAAFYQFFRDRETSAGAQRAEGADDARAPAPVATPAPATPAQAAADAGTALSPTHVRGRLDALIAGQVASGALTGEQAGALRRTLGQASGPSGGQAPAQDAAGPRTTPSPAEAPSPDPAAQDSARAPDDAWNPGEVLATFIQNLQVAQAPRASYGRDGSAPAPSRGSRLLDFNT